jgi:hypothetical protein
MLTVFLKPEEIMPAAIAYFGVIFTILKFKLDSAHYHSNLYDKRFAVFLTIDQALITWAGNGGRSNSEINGKISDSLMRHSHFLFNYKTYQFIEKFRTAMICTE